MRSVDQSKVLNRLLPGSTCNDAIAGGHYNIAHFSHTKIHVFIFTFSSFPVV
jgi:hypothetical protein